MIKSEDYDYTCVYSSMDPKIVDVNNIVREANGRGAGGGGAGSGGRARLRQVNNKKSVYTRTVVSEVDTMIAAA